MNLKNILLTVTDLENVNYRKESHFSQTLQRDKKLYIFLVMTSWPVAQLLNLMQKKLADKSKYKVILMLHIFKNY